MQSQIKSTLRNYRLKKPQRHCELVEANQYLTIFCEAKKKRYVLASQEWFKN